MIIPPFDPNAMAQPGTIPPPADLHHNGPTPAVQPGWFRRAALWIGISLLFILLVVTNWPKFQGMLASPTATPTVTATETSLPTVTPTKTVSPTPRVTALPTATTGTVTGKVMWGEQPFEDVTVKLCADPVFTGYCKEVAAEIVTDAQGQFAFNEVEPGKYTLISFSPGDLGLMFHKDEFPLEVAAGQTLTMDPFQQCKYNFSAQTPVLNKDNSVTLRWSDYPSGLYHWFFEDIYTGGVRDYWVNYRSVTTRDLDPGQYLFLVVAAAYDGMGPSCSIMWFTIP